VKPGNHRECSAPGRFTVSVEAEKEKNMPDEKPNLAFIREQLQVADKLAKWHVEFVVVPLAALPKGAREIYTQASREMADEILYKEAGTA